MGPEKSFVLPGFGLSFGFTLCVLCLVVLIPLATLVTHTLGMGWQAFGIAAFSPRVVAAYRLSFGGAFIAAIFDGIGGLLLAWVLVRYDFPGRRVADAIVDLPFALPTAVAGIALSALYAPRGLIGHFLALAGFKVAFTPAGAVIAMIFIGLPFVVRTVQPVLDDIEAEHEEAAASLGASGRQIFLRVILPTIGPALVTGFALAFARALGEYGSVIFIAGNLPGVSEIAPLLIVTKLEQYDSAGATAIALVMLLASFAMLLLINTMQTWRRSRWTAG